MNQARPSPLKSLNGTARVTEHAGSTAPAASAGARQGVARQGVPSALPRSWEPVPPSEDPTPGAPGIRIYAPPVYRSHWDGARWSIRTSATPTAAYACRCGRTNRATGRAAVGELVAEYAGHKSTCTGNPAPQAERRNAA